MGYKTQKKRNTAHNIDTRRFYADKNSMQICTHSQDRMPYSLICGDIYRHLVLMVFALALTANGMITLPSAFIRIIGKGSIFVSDLSEYTMLFFGAASLFFGLGLILLSVARICPFAASFVYRLFSKTKE